MITEASELIATLIGLRARCSRFSGLRIQLPLRQSARSAPDSEKTLDAYGPPAILTSALGDGVGARRQLERSSGCAVPADRADAARRGRADRWVERLQLRHRDRHTGQCARKRDAFPLQGDLARSIGIAGSSARHAATARPRAARQSLPLQPRDRGGPVSFEQPRREFVESAAPRQPLVRGLR